MAVDVLNFDQLQQAERTLLMPEPGENFGVFKAGESESGSVGVGFTVDGYKDYEQGDEMRLVDWKKSASRTDDGLWLKEFVDERAPLFVFASDLPSDRYARTPGDRWSSRSLGLVASHALMRSANIENAALLPIWSIGEVTPFDIEPLPKPQQGRFAARRSMEPGLALASHATEVLRQGRMDQQERALAMSKMSKRQQKKFLESADELPMVDAPVARPFAEVVDFAARRSDRYNDVAQFMIMSDFISGVDETAEAISKVSRDSDVTAVQIVNPGLFELPPVGESYTLTSGRNLLVESEDQRSTFRERTKERQSGIEAALRSTGARFVTLNTADPVWLQQLVAGLKA